MTEALPPVTAAESPWMLWRWTNLSA